MIKQFMLILFAIATVSAQARNYTDIIQSGYIRIAVYRDFPPYSYQVAGKAEGIDIEIGKQLAKQLGVTPQWFWLTADENIEDDLRNAVWKGHYLGGGVADVMLRVPHTQEFAQLKDADGELKNDKVLLLGPYHKEGWTVIRNTEQLPELINLAAFQYHKVGVEIDSVPDFALTSMFASRLANNVVHYRTLPEAVDAITQGDVAAVVGMKGPIEWRLASVKTAGANSNSAANANTLVISGKSIEQWPYRQWDIGIAVKKPFQQLGKVLEAEMKNMVGNGNIAAIFSQYHVSYEAPDAL